MNEITFRYSKEDDLTEIIKLLSEDDLGKKREKFTFPLPECYINAYREILSDKNNNIIIAQKSEKIIGCMQMTVTPYLVRSGSKRATFEGVRICAKERGNGIGTAMFKWAIEKAKECGCSLVQLDTDMSRISAHNFYKKLGFSATHYGMKLYL